ncbi:hypothetical protein [Arthrobacter sp. Helios]|nr:hypothetical protein [Arthrobacter sp. Helios]
MRRERAGKRIQAYADDGGTVLLVTHGPGAAADRRAVVPAD